MLGSICRGVPSEMPKLKFQTLFLGPVVCAMAVVFAASAGAGDATGQLTVGHDSPDEQLAQRDIDVPRRDDRIRRGETVTNRERPELDALGARRTSDIQKFLQNQLGLGEDPQKLFGLFVHQFRNLFLLVKKCHLRS